jgi:hypothetical protein
MTRDSNLGRDDDILGGESDDDDESLGITFGNMNSKKGPKAAPARPILNNAKESKVLKTPTVQKQNKKAKICFVIYIAGERIFFLYTCDVINSPEKEKNSANHYSGQGRR